MKTFAPALIAAAAALTVRAAEPPLNNPCLETSVTNLCVTQPSVTLGASTLDQPKVCLGGEVSASVAPPTIASGTARWDTNYANCPAATGTPYTVTPCVLKEWWVVTGPGGFAATGDGLSAKVTPLNPGQGTITFYCQWSCVWPCDNGIASSAVDFTVLAPNWATNCWQEALITVGPSSVYQVRTNLLETNLVLCSSNFIQIGVETEIPIGVLTGIPATWEVVDLNGLCPSMIKHGAPNILSIDWDIVGDVNVTTLSGWTTVAHFIVTGCKTDACQGYLIFTVRYVSPYPCDQNNPKIAQSITFFWGTTNACPANP